MTNTLLDARVAAIRRFNRFYTKQIGALQEGLLDSEFSLAEARVLYELANADGDSTATSIGATLGLDAGYLSRLLRSFEERRLVQRRASSADGRRSNLTLTRKGRSAFTRLDASARGQIATWLEGHPPAAQRVLVSAMESIEQRARERRGAPCRDRAARAPSWRHGLGHRAARGALCGGVRME